MLYIYYINNGSKLTIQASKKNLREAKTHQQSQKESQKTKCQTSTNL